MFKESHMIIEMIMAVLLISAVYSEKKPDFGIITACVKNKSLRVDCSYPSCDSTPFNCHIYEVEENSRTLIGSSDWAMVNSDISYLDAASGVCRLTIKDHATIYFNKTKIYTCYLSRRTSKEMKTITVQYKKRKEKPKACLSGGPFLHVSLLLCSIAFLFIQEMCL